MAHRVPSTDLNQGEILKHLESLAAALEVGIRYENLARGKPAISKGGLCRIRGRPVIIVHKESCLEEKIELLAESLKRFDLSGRYVLPAIRELLEKQG